MQTDALTSDTLYYQSLNEARKDVSHFTAHSVNHELPEAVAGYVRNSLASNTQRAYLGDLAHFEAWGGSVPASAEMIASYLAEHAGALAVATLVRRVTSISKAHEARNLMNPCRAEIVKATMRGIKRRWGCAQDQAKALVREDLFLTLDAMGAGIKDVRDRALLLIGFAGGFRRSELVALDCADIETVRQGLIVVIRRSKTDQEGAGRKIGVPHGRTRHCPVAALERWLEISGIEAGAIFRPVDRHGRLASTRLTGDAVSVIVKERVAGAGMDPSGFSGHSLRAGFATSASQAGVSSLKIRAQTGHSSDSMLQRYIRDGEIFLGNAAGVLL
jgi:integrase